MQFDILSLLWYNINTQNYVFPPKWGDSIRFQSLKGGNERSFCWIASKPEDTRCPLFSFRPISRFLLTDKPGE